MVFGSAVNASHMNGSDHSMLGVIGSLGTADVQGTALTLSPGINPITGAMYVDVGTSVGGGSGGTVVTVDHGTVTISNPSVGGTFNNISTGTLQTLGTVNIVNSLAIRTTSLGTVGTVSDGAQGTLRLDGNNAVYVNNAYKLDSTNDSVTAVLGSGGTITALGAGTITTGTVSVTTGTMVLNTGTITTIAAGTQNTLGTVGVVNNIVTGTLANSGTTTGVGVVTTVTTVSNLTNGSVNLLTGTLTSLSNLVTGTLSNVTLNQKWTGSTILTTHTRGTAGGTTLGTLIAPVGAGTNVYVNGLSIASVSGTPDCAIMTNVVGSTGAGVLTRGVFAPGGGIARSFSNPILVGTNGTIAYMILNGTADFALDYWIGP